MARAIRQLPVTERGYGVKCITKTGREFIISHCPEKERFTLWEVGTNEYKKMCDAKTPQALYDKVPWKE